MRTLIFSTIASCILIMLMSNITSMLHTKLEIITSAPTQPCEVCETCEREEPKTSLVEMDISTSSQGKVFVATPVRSIRDHLELNWMANDFNLFKDRPTADPQCDRWIVITTIFEPTTLVRQIERAVDDWCLVVVGDKKSPPGYNVGPKVKFLTPQDQESLGYRILKHIPWNHFGRKNVGFMYAIQHGAKLIYDTDDDNLLKMPLADVAPGGDTPAYALVSSSVVTNVYPLFSSNFSWPRGFPLDRINDPTSVGTISKNVTTAKVGVYQSLADWDPDVDAIYRLTRPLPLNFDKVPAKGALVLPHGTFSPYNAQATLFTEDALWALLLPVTVHGRVSDIWRSYFMQRIMWDLDLHVAFVPPFVKQCRNVHSYIADLEAEDHLYGRTLELIRVLLEWEPKARNVAGRLVEISGILYEHAFLELQDVQLMQAWVRDLQEFGLQLPHVGRKTYNGESAKMYIHETARECEQAILRSFNNT